MSYDGEFSTIELLRESEAETRGVDAFSLSLIKTERQIRKLFTCLVFQYPCFTEDNISDLRETLGSNRNVYFKGFLRGIDEIYPISVKELIGDEYDNLLVNIDKATEYRNKIFHGQLTGKQLSREELFDLVDKLSEWCRLLSTAANQEIGYGGFERNSFQKLDNKNIYKSYKCKIDGIDEYKIFIKHNMQR